MKFGTSVFVGLIVLIGSAFGQFAISQELSGQQVTITKADLEAAMTPGEVEELEQTNRVLEELKAFGLRLKRDDPERADIAAMYNRRIEERNQKFAHLRGLNGQSFIGYGAPPPSAIEVVDIIVRQRLHSEGSGILYPHWERIRDGAVIGTTSVPTYETGEGEGYRAGEEARLFVPGTDEDVILEAPDDDCSVLFGASCP